MSSWVVLFTALILLTSRRVFCTCAVHTEMDFFFPVEIVKAFEEACVDTQDYMQKDYLAHQEYIRLSVDVK